MFYDDASDPAILAKKAGFSIFVEKDIEKFLQKFTEQITPSQITLVSPGENHKIVVTQIREIIAHSQNKQTRDYFFILTSANTMNIEAQNAFLKLLEEPPENYHFVMQANDLSNLLPTILSRADIYYFRESSHLTSPVIADELAKEYAKRIISLKSHELVSLVNQLTSEKAYKADSRGFALAITDCAIEISYKSYFKTKNPAFLKKLPKLLTLQEGLRQNGHIKLHLVADLC